MILLIVLDKVLGKMPTMNQVWEIEASNKKNSSTCVALGRSVRTQEHAICLLLAGSMDKVGHNASVLCSE